MLSFILKIVTTITLALSLTSLAACAVIETPPPQPPHPALLGFDVDCESKPDPCWFGIVPGLTPIEEGQERLRQYVYKTSEVADESQPRILPECVVTTEPMPDNQVWGTLVLHCSNLKLGDVARKLGVDVDVLLTMGSVLGVEFGTPTINAWVNKGEALDNCTPVRELILTAAQYTASSYGSARPSSTKWSSDWCRE